MEAHAEDEGARPERPLRVGPALAFGWEVVSGNLGAWIPAALALAAAGFVPDLIATRLQEQDAVFLAFAASLLGLILVSFVWLGVVRMALDAVEGKEVRLGTLTSQGDLVLRYVVASIIFGVAFTLGLVFFVVPGLVVLVFLYFYGYVLVDRRTGILDCLRGSADLGEGNRLRILLLLAALALVNLVGFLLLLVGLLVSLPVTFAASAHAYRQLQGPLDGEALHPDQRTA